MQQRRTCAGSINLMRGAKRTANRDVKIDLAKAAEEPAEASEAEEEEEGEGEGEEGDGVEATESAQVRYRVII